jgi:hypothetical protein
MTALAIAIVLGIPVLVLGALPWLVDVRRARREQAVSRQIALTDAIHGVLGPVVAPVVRRGRSGWIGVLPLPPGHPHVGRMVEIAQAELGPTAKIVLVAQEPLPPCPRREAVPARLAA